MPTDDTHIDLTTRTRRGLIRFVLYVKKCKTHQALLRELCKTYGIRNWRAHIKVNGKAMSLGSYVKLDDAVKARHTAEQQYFGEYARQY